MFAERREKPITPTKTTSDSNSKKHKCPHCPRLFVSKTGLGSHLRSHGIQGSAKSTVAARLAKEQAAPTSAPQPPAPLLIICPDCPEKFLNTRMLGLHRRHHHGVVSPTADLRALKKQQKELAGKPSTPAERSDPVNVTKRSSLKHSNAVEGGNHASPNPSLDPIAYAICIGSLKEFCRHFAEEHDVPTRQFTRQCAELFYRQTLR